MYKPVTKIDIYSKYIFRGPSDFLTRMNTQSIQETIFILTNVSAKNNQPIKFESSLGFPRRHVESLHIDSINDGEICLIVVEEKNHSISECL